MSSVGSVINIYDFTDCGRYLRMFVSPTLDRIYENVPMCILGRRKVCE